MQMLKTVHRDFSWIVSVLFIQMPKYLQTTQGYCDVLYVSVCFSQRQQVCGRKQIGKIVFDREIERKRVTGRNPIPVRKHCISFTGRKRERDTLLWLQSEIFSVETPKPKGTDVFFFFCVYMLVFRDVCVFMYVGTILLHLFNI